MSSIKTIYQFKEDTTLWICDSCGYENNSFATACSFCGDSKRKPDIKKTEVINFVPQIKEPSKSKHASLIVLFPVLALAIIFIWLLVSYLLGFRF